MSDEEIVALIEPVVHEFGLVLYDVELVTRRGRSVLEVTIDRPNGRSPGAGVTLDALIEVNRELSAVLDIDDPVDGAYELEVASPGVERKLTRPRHFQQSVGEHVHIVANELIGGDSALDGELIAATASTVTVRRKHDSAELTAPMHAIKSARTVYDWDANKLRKKPKKQRRKRKG